MSRDFTGISTLVTHRELLVELFKRQLRQEHKGTVMGATWLVIKPLLLLALYVFMFGYVFKGHFHANGDEGPATYALGVFLGLTIIHFLSDIITVSPRCFLDNPQMVKKIKMPIEVLPAAVTANAAVHFFISLGLAVTGLVIFGYTPTLQALWLAPIFIFIAIGGLGVAYLFATLGVFMRDITQITPVLSMGLLFASAVFYPVEKIPALAWTVLRFNPALLAVEGAREAVLWGAPVEIGPAAYYFCGSSIALYFTGYYCFQKTKSRFADLI